MWISWLVFWGKVMNILMMTNTYRPHVGGVARSVEFFTAEFRRQGHDVLVVAPRFEHAKNTGDSLWEQAMRRLSAEWKVWSARAKAGTKALTNTAARSSPYARTGTACRAPTRGG